MEFLFGGQRREVEDLSGLSLLEFGASWCGYCQRAQPLVAEALAENPVAPHIKLSTEAVADLGAISVSSFGRPWCS